MPLRITPNPSAAGRLSIAANQLARMSSVVSIDWDNITYKPTAISDLEGLATPGLIVLTDAVGDLATRTITGTSSQISVANGDGISGNPTLSLDGPIHNTRLAKTANYTVLNTDKGKTLALGGSTLFSLTFGAASGYDSNFSVAVINEDTGRGKIIALNGIASFILWPSQSIIIYAQNSAWKTLGRARWKPPASSTINFYADFTNGTDTIGATDGLATGAAAFKTVERAFLNAASEIDFNTESQTLIVVNMADNTTDTTGMHVPVHALVGAQGGAAFKIKGGTNSIISTTGVDAISAYFGSVLYLQNVTLRSDVNGLDALWGSKVYLDGVTFGGGGIVPAGGHIAVQGGAQIEQAGTVTFAGNSAYGIFNSSGQYRTQGQSFAFSADAAFSSAFLFAIGPSYTSFGSTTINLNAHTITGTRFQISNGAYVATGTGAGSLTYFPGSVAGTVTSGATYDTVMTTSVAQGGTGAQTASGTALDNITGFSSTGQIARTGSGAYAFRTLTAPAAGITISNGDGVSGNPTLVLANDLAAIEGLSSTGMIARTATDTAAVRTITAGTGASVSNGDGVSGNPTVAVSLSTASNTISGDIALNNTANYFDGPSCAQGTSGTWFVSGTVSVVGNLGDQIICKLWDGTTIISSAIFQQTASSGIQQTSVTLSGFIASPAANLRISCRDATSTSGSIKKSDGLNNNASSIYAIRIA